MTTSKTDAVQAEVEAAPKQFTLLSGEVFDLPGRLPYAVMRSLNHEDTDAALQRLLGDRFEEFCDLAAFDDVQRLFTELMGLYGVGAGESEASVASSTNGGTRSRRTSKPSTGSTSA